MIMGIGIIVHLRYYNGEYLLFSYGCNYIARSNDIIHLQYILDEERHDTYGTCTAHRKSTNIP